MPMAPCPAAGRANIRRQDFSNIRGQSQAIKSGLGQHDRVIITALQLGDACVHISAQVQNLQIISRMEQLRLPAQTARAHARADPTAPAISRN